jgi:hypothetical protein
MKLPEPQVVPLSASMELFRGWAEVKALENREKRARLAALLPTEAARVYLLLRASRTPRVLDWDTEPSSFQLAVRAALRDPRAKQARPSNAG